MNIIKTLQAENLGKRLILGGKPFVGGVCFHDTAGSGTHNDTLYLARPSDGRSVSVDFTVERDGSIYQLNPDLTNKCTFHAGRATKYKTNGRVFKNREVTQVLIGVELVHKANPALQSPLWPTEQVKAAAELAFYLCSIYGLTKEQITTHAAVITDGSRIDPRDFPFNAFWFHFNAQGSPDPKTPPANPLSQPIVYKVKAGDTLSKISNMFAVPIETIKEINGIAEASNLIRVDQTLVIRK